MPHRIWSLQKVNDIIDVYGVSENSSGYIAWNLKLSDRLVSMNREGAIYIPSQEEIFIEVKEGQYNLLEHEETLNTICTEIRRYVKGELWDNKLQVIMGFIEEMVRDDSKEELNRIFEGAKLIVDAERDLEKWALYKADAGYNKMQYITLPEILLNPFAQIVIGEIVAVLVTTVVEPLVEPIPEAIRSGMQRLRNRLRSQKPTEDREKMIKEFEKVIFIQDYKKRKEERKNSYLKG
ncbi:hypothetical protein [Peribacillus sp. RS7]